MRRTFKVGGHWTYLYRAVDQNGKSVDFILSQRRDVGAAKTFFRRALQKHGDPLSITLDAYAASHRAVRELKKSGEILYQKMRVMRLPQCRRAGPQTREEAGGPDARVQILRERR